jgi:hypothetical protein
MRWAEGSIQRAKTFAWATVLLGAGALHGGMIAKASGDTIPDREMSRHSFDDTIAFEPADDADAAEPPLEVHEIDEGQVTAAGGKKVVDGEVWLDADDVERNDILNLVEDDQPEDSILVIVIATGDIWRIPRAAGQALPAGVRAWSGDEYFELDEYMDRRYKNRQLTLAEFEFITSVANVNTLARILYVHNFGELGYREITSRQGFQVALANTWLRETPVQRSMRILMWKKIFGRLPQFQGEGNQLAVGVMVPGGSVYVMPETSYQYMVGQRALRAWMVYEIVGLPTTMLLLDRAIKNSQITVGRVREP